MRHQKSGKKLNRNTAERKSLYRNLITSVITHNRIRTTESKAKAVKPFLEKVITMAKKNTDAARRMLSSEVMTDEARNKLNTELVERFKDRPGGYSRILKLGPRSGDQTKMVYLELLASDHKKEEKKKSKES